MKALIACDPRGAFMFTSTLFTGSLSDKEIVKRNNFLEVMSTLPGHFLSVGDRVMVANSFLIESELQNIGPAVSILI